MRLEIHTQDAGRFHVIQLRGKVDLYTSRELKSLLSGHINGSRPGIVIDMAAVTYIDSPGLGVLIQANNHIREAHGRLILAHVPETIRRVFQLTKLEHVFEFEPNVDSAIQSLQSAGQT
ncbi:MAG: STAS domain-containing protein [Leptospiraceae bacterium]|nr:STAS domain-containing protein [Leptospiraceae bacterium]MCB1314395.1 STAS domain-containing protein [Leptospiraceae bacterium]MCB1322992.1 STAS domain-containing protein [Leptospiraceae bacterium]